VTPPIVELERVTKRFGGVTAVDEVSLALHPGRTLGVVGESGCGKSTTARLIVGLERPSAGELRFNGAAYGRSGRTLRAARKAIGMIFQDPYESLDARFTLKLTPSTACTAAICFWKMIPRVIGKYFLIPSSRMSGSLALASICGERSSTVTLMCAPPAARGRCVPSPPA